VTTIKLFEYLSLQVIGNADAVVAHMQFEPVAADSNCAYHYPAAFGVFDRVVDQVADDLAQNTDVAVYGIGRPGA